MMVPEVDPEVAHLVPALTEFVGAVRDRDGDLVQACFMLTDPGALAVLAAGWVADLQTHAEVEAKAVGRAQREAAALRKEADRVRADLSVALKKITRLQGDLYLARKEAA